jgi:enoyl-CoA hydratase
MITLERADGFSWLRMNDGKANAIRMDFLDELDRRLDEASGPLVVTGAGKFFSGGLDLPALHGLGRDEVEGLLRQFETTFLRLFAWPAPVVAAVNGHAIAGGCILAMQADYRVGVNAPLQMGINEVAIGVGLPAFVVETFRARIAPAALARLALQGVLLAPGEAREAGLLDEVVEAGSLVARAGEKVRELASVSAAAFAQAKALLRRPALSALAATRNADADSWLDVWFSEPAQAQIASIVARLKAPRGA